MMNFYIPLSAAAKLVFISLSLLTWLAPVEVFASYMAGQITVTHVSGISYTITQKVYRDCNGLPPGNTVPVRIIGGPAFLTVNLTRTSITDRSILCPGQVSNCVSGSGMSGIEEHTYSATVNLSSNISYVLVSDLASRNAAITTLTNPDSQSMFLATTFKTVTVNNSPNFLNRPVAVFCQGQLSTFYPGGFDADGDSLVYSLIDARGASGSLVNYAGGFSGTAPLSSSSAITVNPATGLITFIPTTLDEVAVICLRVEEYRNGVKIGAVNRDIQVKIINCNAIVPPVITCPANIQATVNAAGCKATVNYTVSAPDNCTQVLITQIAGLPSGSDFPLGTTTNTFVAIDAMGNTDTCSFTVTVTTNLSVNAGVDEETFFGYRNDETVTRTAVATGGVPGYSYSWTLSRPLMCNLVTSTGDEAFAGGSCLNNHCPSSGAPTVPPTCTGSATISATLAQDADVCVTVTDSKGCQATDCFHIYSEDVRCFSRSSKTVICHATGSLTNPWVQICVAQSAVQAHFALNPNDRLGPCPVAKTDLGEDEDAAAAADAQPAVIAYPNPFSHQLNIEFTLPQDSKAKLELLSVTGQLLNVLFEGPIRAGELHKATFNSAGFSKGMIIYRLQTEHKTYYGRVMMMQ